MGYTHYWKVKRPVALATWRAITKDVGALLKASPVRVSWDFDRPKKAVEISDTAIRFNGVGEEGHETFLLENTRADFEFCKTARKPYDLLVCAVLIVVEKHAAKAFEITSDGESKEREWLDALAFVHKVLGPDYALPHLIRA